MRENAPTRPHAPRNARWGGGHFSQSAAIELQLRWYLLTSGFTARFLLLASLHTPPFLCAARGSPSEGRGTGSSCPMPSVGEPALCSSRMPQSPGADAHGNVSLSAQRQHHRCLLWVTTVASIKSWATAVMAVKSRVLKRSKGSSMPLKSTWLKYSWCLEAPRPC